ncbi:hypothetical protein OU994_18190 [Pseudoduganella sp. SL102]|uniref:hypothetical protein n=1 Tax=Pseudoduganella sp. SL102 TaxID=2995154 RepID=UPI00248BE015|nr:hypothetical protein [Pseudoduganella sp. SL102]WBS00252.1 hypothetical protein OU994_18190 [Pseudoduganella sp. SL102]
MTTQRLSTWLALRCREAPFQRFLRVPDEQAAAQSVRAICAVESRGEIDRDEAAARRFHTLIRIPYANFMLDPNNQTTTEEM